MEKYQKLVKACQVAFQKFSDPDFRGQFFSSHLRDNFEQVEKLQFLIFMQNSISGPIPESRGLNIGYNEFSGTLPESFGGLSNLEVLIYGNRLKGVVSEFHFAILTKLNIIGASGNSLILKVRPDWIPPFQLEALDLSSSHLGSQFPMWIKSQKRMEYLVKNSNFWYHSFLVLELIV